MKGLNLSQFKKVKEDKKTATMQHPSGHTITIYKDKLPALHRKQLEKIPIKMDEGGTVYGNDTFSNAQEQQNANDLSAGASQGGDSVGYMVQGIRQGIKDLTGYASGGDVIEPHSGGSGGTRGYYAGGTDFVTGNPDDDSFAQNSTKMPEGLDLAMNAPSSSPMDTTTGNQPSSDAPAQSASSGPSPSPNLDAATTPVSKQPPPPATVANAIDQKMSDVNPRLAVQGQGVDVPGAFNQSQLAIAQQADIDARKSQMDQKIQGDRAKDLQDLNTESQNHYKLLAEQSKHFNDDVAANPINPKHYIENMSTPAKVSTAIGLLLGGFSQGLRGGSNPAADWLNGQIDRDIQGQKDRYGQQKTLLEANTNLFNDHQMALNQTKVNLMDIYNANIQQAAAKLGTPQAVASANKALADNALQKDQLLRSSAMRGAINTRLASGAPVDPLDLANAGYMSPEDAQKEQASLDRQRLRVASLTDAANQLDKLQSASGLLNDPLGHERGAIIAQMKNTLQSSEPSKRYSEEQMNNIVEPLISKFSQGPEGRQAALQGALNIVRNDESGNTPHLNKISPATLPNYQAALRSAGTTVQFPDGSTKRVPSYQLSLATGPMKGKIVNGR